MKYLAGAAKSSFPPSSHELSLATDRFDRLQPAKSKANYHRQLNTPLPMKEPTALEQEETWYNAWSELYELTRKIGPYSIFLPDGTEVEFEALKAWLQDSAYEGHCVGLRHYFQKVYYGKPQDTGRYQIHAKRWLFGEPEPDWTNETDDGYVLQPRMH